MSKWMYIKEHELLHESGFRLELIAGTWQFPSELNPVTVEEHSPVTTAGLIREGLNFSKRNNPPKVTQRIKNH